MANFAKPENALKRAEELINVGQKQDALQSLHDLITSKRYRAWQKTHEKIMFKYIELCVDMRRGRFAKDGLIQYRIICQQVNVSSLEEVIKHFMDLSTKRAEAARSQAQALEEALDVDDLEADNRPEDLMLSYVSGEKGKDRSDRELVTPWFKFLWETYRTVLEILRNNSKLMALYADTAHRAFQFCKQYKRTTEFRRLCEIIRNHLANLNKYRDQRDRPDLSAPESMQFYLDTRFEQLKIATELELWQEAFRSVEDIYGLTCMVKKMPKTSWMAVYYAKLTEIFWISTSHLYHAYAWFKLFQLQKSFNKNLNQKDLQLIASSVLLAAMSVPPYDHTRRASHLELEHEKDRNLRMSNLIGFNLDTKIEGRDMLSRSSLLSDLISKGVMTYVTQEVKDLYHLLEHEFLPLDLASKVQPLLAKISKVGGKISSASSVPEVQLSQYVPALEKLATLRLLQQVSQVYQTMSIESLAKMVPFFDFPAVEKLSVDAVKHDFVAMKVDHMKAAVIFSTLGLESDGLRSHLSLFAESLNKSRSMIYPSERKISRLGEMLPNLAEVVDKEHKRLLARKSVIEKRKEEQERHLLEREREEESKRLKLQKITEEAEQRRLASEIEQRRNQRILREIEERELEEAQALLQEAEKRGRKKGVSKLNMETNTTAMTILFFLLPLLSFFLLSRFRRKRYPPGPKGWPIIGNLLMMDKLSHRGLAKLAAQYGGLVHLRMGFLHMFTVSTPDMAREVLQIQDNIFANRPATMNIRYLTYDRADMAFANYGPFWRQMRKISVMKLFSRKRAESWDSVREEVDDMVKIVLSNTGCSVNIGELVFGLTRNIIYRAAFGTLSHEGQDEFIKILQEFSKLFGAFNICDFVPGLTWADPQGFMGRLVKARASLDGFIDSIIDAHIEKKKSSKNGIIDEGNSDMVYELLDFYSEDKAKVSESEDVNNSLKLTRDNIKAIIMDVMFGGTETVASAIEWAMSELMRSPEDLKKVQQELLNVVGLHRRVEESDFDKLTYLKCCMKETLRLHPPIPLLLHETAQDAEVAGYHIPARSRVIINSWAINRDPNSWADPDTFKPSRFLEEGMPDFKGSNFEFIPFGSGRRSCPGMQLGLYALEIAVAHLLHCFNWELPDGMKPSEVDTDDVFGLTAPRATRLVAVPTPRLLCPIC